jgi:GTP-binding protein
MIPVIALVGRPNVGKSTLFNRLTRTRDALVADVPGLTRDRQYGEGKHEQKRFIVIDTGGISGGEDGIDEAMAGQSLLAIEEADLVFFLVDAREGLTQGDQYILDDLRRREKKVNLLVNKVDGMDPDVAASEFYQLGMDNLHLIAASQGRGVSKLMDLILGELEQEISADDIDVSQAGIRIAIAGRPNVGKSTLVNRMLGEERVIVFDKAGTTRDSITIPFERHGKLYTLIDTAGIRKRGKTYEMVEKFSVVKSLQAIQDAHVVVMLIDAREGIVEQDLHLLGYIHDTGRALVIAINKWDGMDEYAKDKVKESVQRRLLFVDFAKIHFISAKFGSGVGNLYESIEKSHSSAFRKLTTAKLNQTLERITQAFQPPIYDGRRIKLRYAHLGGKNPPIIVIHGKQTEKLPASYMRYLEKNFRKILKLEGTPIRIELRSDANPYVNNENELNYRQVARKRKILKNREYLRGRKRPA